MHKAGDALKVDGTGCDGVQKRVRGASVAKGCMYVTLSLASTLIGKMQRRHDDGQQQLSPLFLPTLFYIQNIHVLDTHGAITKRYPARESGVGQHLARFGHV